MDTHGSVDESEMKWTDPLLLLDVLVVDTILEVMDDATLLTGRLVCRRWKNEITQRKGLWRRRCERLGTHDPDKAFPRDTFFFPVYLNFKRMLGQMSRGQGWKVDDACDGSQCAFHRELAPYSERDGWVSALVPDKLLFKPCQKKIVLYPFLLVCLTNSKVSLVNDKMQVFPLRLPQLSEQQDSQDSADAEPIVDLIFKIAVDSDGQLAVAIERKSSMCFITFTTRGEILHHVLFKCDCLTEWSPLAPGQGRYRFVCRFEGHVVARAMHFSSRGITVEQLWKKALPADCQRQMVLAGHKFLLCCKGTNLRAYRMVDGTLAADFTGFPLGPGLKTTTFVIKTGSCTRTIEKIVDIINRREVFLNKDDGRPETMYFVNYDWLDGLSPSTMRSDCPVAVIFSTDHPRGRCLRWSGGLWDGFPAHSTNR
ncbi:hypothetical protein ACOMHN_056964 [Nucella lapillus]